MTEGEILPPDDTFAIHCTLSKMPNGVAQPPLFQPREDDDYLSGAWLESTELRDQLDQVREVCRQLKESKSREVKASHKFALLNVGNAQESVKSRCNHELDFIHHPLPIYTSHSGIYGIEQDAHNISVELSEICFMEPAFLG